MVRVFNTNKKDIDGTLNSSPNKLRSFHLCLITIFHTSTNKHRGKLLFSN